MEALQMLKFHLKKVHLNFAQDWITLENKMLVDDPGEDLLESLLRGSFQDGMDRII
jgi:hypothetical protein